MKDLALKTQGIRGGTPKWTEKVGYVNVFYDGTARTSILIDNFVGYGDDYKRREEPIIDIQEEGKIVFSGTIKQLREKLNN